jgi:hypothetical protein|tara:strand:+ start:893 stop:1474 length:582 start_codon:yes stop_codon:yes gene_type:complete
MARNQLNELLQDLDSLAVNLAFNGPARAAEEMIKDLQEESPAWTGKFRNSWFIQSPNGQKTGGGGQPGEAIPVKAPALSGAQVGKAFLQKLIGSKSDSSRLFTIGNSAEYADQATDLAPFKFEGPIPPRVAKTEFRKFGIRPKGSNIKRGDVQGSGGNTSSAPLDWFSNYHGSGRADEAVKRAYSRGFRGFRR